MSGMTGGRGRLWALACVAALLLFSGPLWAEEGADEEAGEETPAAAQPAGPTPKLFILPVDSLRGEVTSLVTERVNESTRRRVEAHRGSTLLPSMRQMLGTGELTGPAALVEAEQQYTSGIGLLRAGQYRRAAETLQRAVDLMERNLEGLSNFNILTDALSNLAAAHFQAGYDLDARQTIQRFAQLRPDATLDPEIYPEGLRELFSDEVDRVQRAETGILQISTTRPGALVTLDGVLRGETPLTVDEVGFGHHYLVVQQGEEIFRDVIRVRARGQEEFIEVDFAAAAEEDGVDAMPAFYTSLQEQLRTGRFRDEEIRPALGELVALTEADYVAWVIVFRQGPRYQAAPFVFRVSDEVLVQGAQVDFNLELTNLRVRVDRLVANITGPIDAHPSDLVVAAVDLDPAEAARPPVAAAPEVTEHEEVGEEEPVEVAEAEEVLTPLPAPDPTRPPAPSAIEEPRVDRDRSNTMRYLGWGGAAALAGGAVVTTVVLLVRSGSSEPAFDAEVEW